MLPREIERLPDYIYPHEEWRMVETRFHPRLLGRMETLFATANGYLGLRGSFEEGDPVDQSGTFVNGFYESWPIVYGEEAYGFAKTGQTIVNVTDAKIIKLYVDDEPFYLPTATLTKFGRALDMRNGTLDREVIWETPAGKRVSIKSKRIVSFEHRHVAAICYEVTLLNEEAPVVISSEVINEDTREAQHDDPRRPRGFRGRVLIPTVHRADDLRIVLGHSTKSSKMSLACGVEHVVETECEYTHELMNNEDSAKVVISAQARPGIPIRLVKYMAYHTSRHSTPEELSERAERSLDRAVKNGFQSLCDSQRAYLDDFWEQGDIVVFDEPRVQQALRFNIFQILQATARAEGVGVPAKGLTGQGYEGHYFWDTEIYVLPFLIYTMPRVARNLLKFRHSYLNKARERARQVNQRGALFPWRTINGEEASAYYAAGTAQYHINAAIAYSLKKYVDVTGDEEFLFEVGAEILIETARLWADLGFYSSRKGDQFCIHGVTGPDEYNTVVNNNTYTNLMARTNLRYAAEKLEWLQQEHPGHYRALVDRTGLDVSEIAEWRRAAENMYVPFDEEARVHPQDDNFLDKEPLDLEQLPADRFPLLLHHHPLVIYRHQVIKQADVVLAMFLLGHEFAGGQKKRNFDYYEPLTTGDSSLSVSIQAIVAAELGYADKAQEYVRYASQMDLADVGGNVEDGCHIASMGGTWMAIVYGLLGLRDWDGEISFKPTRLGLLRGGKLCLRIRGQLLEIEGRPDGITYTLREGEGLTFRHHEREIRLEPGSPVTVSAPAADDSGPGPRGPS